jgi:hypothetical protein
LTADRCWHINQLEVANRVATKEVSGRDADDDRAADSDIDLLRLKEFTDKFGDMRWAS